MFNLVLPAVFITATTIMVFYLPAASGEKVSLGVTVLLALTVFLLMVAESMPPQSDSIPLMGKYVWNGFKFKYMGNCFKFKCMIALTHVFTCLSKIPNSFKFQIPLRTIGILLWHTSKFQFTSWKSLKICGHLMDYEVFKCSLFLEYWYKWILPHFGD